MPSISSRRPLRSLARGPIALTAVIALGAGGLTASTADAAAKPTVVLVHGAFADASGWTGAVEILQRKGYKVLAPANPLRGVSSDATYLKAKLATVKGPIVLVGHSYGGVVISNAATGNPNVKALVYVAAYAPDEGETVAGLGAQIPGGMIGPPTLDLSSYPLPDGTGALEGTIKTDVYPKIFAADVPEPLVSAMAATQRPAAVASLGEPSGPPAWKTIPSWYLLPTKDLAIGVKLEAFMAKRMRAAVTKVRGASHAVLVSQPKATAQLIIDAAKGKR